MKIVLNPGHGPKSSGVFDPGAVGPAGTREADVNLAVAKLLQPLLEATGAQVLLIRDGDLGDVVSQANASGADYFISIHCNAASSSAAHGTETYIYKADSQAKKLAEAIQAAAAAELGTADRGVKTADFYVLRKTAMPALLIELAFVSNPEEEGLLSDQDIQRRIALTLADTIITHLGINPGSDDGVTVAIRGAADIILRGKRIDGVTYLPARACLEALGYQVDWEPGRVDAWTKQ